MFFRNDQIVGTRSRAIRTAMIILAFIGPMIVGGTSLAVAQTVTKEVHYQKSFAMNCIGIACTATISTVAANRRLILEHMSCQLVGATGGAMIPGELQVKTATNNVVLRKTISPSFKNSDNVVGYYVYDQRMDLYISATQHGEMGIGHSSGNISSAICDLTGRLQTLH